MVTVGDDHQRPDSTVSGSDRPAGAVPYGAVPNIALPRPRPIRRTGVAVPVVPTEAATPEIIESAGLRWIQIESPRAPVRDWLEAHFDFHPPDYEDVNSRKQPAEAWTRTTIT